MRDLLGVLKEGEWRGSREDQKVGDRLHRLEGGEIGKEEREGEG